MEFITKSSPSDIFSSLSNIGPLVDDRALNFRTGYSELFLLKSLLSLNKDIQLNGISNVLLGRSHCQYRTGQPSSASWKVMESTVVIDLWDSRGALAIRYTVLDGSIQRFTDKIVTKNGNSLHIEWSVLQIKVKEKLDIFALVEHKFISFMPMRAAYTHAPDENDTY